MFREMLRRRIVAGDEYTVPQSTYALRYSLPTQADVSVRIEQTARTDRKRHTLGLIWGTHSPGLAVFERPVVPLIGPVLHLLDRWCPGWSVVPSICRKYP